MALLAVLRTAVILEQSQVIRGPLAVAHQNLAIADTVIVVHPGVMDVDTAVMAVGLTMAVTAVIFKAAVSLKRSQEILLAKAVMDTLQRQRILQ